MRVKIRYEFNSSLPKREWNMIDTHIHLIPNVDDGAKDINESLKMLDMAFNDGLLK